MKSTLITGLVVCACCAPVSLAQDHHGSQEHGAHAHTEKPLNRMCPIGKEPIVETVPTIEYKGETIGFCCPGCDEEFLAWNEAKRDAFVTNSKAGRDIIAQHDDSDAEPPETVDSEPYTLATCPVSGERLGTMGDPIVKEIDGREVRFCCAMCVPRFEAAKEKYFDRIDREMVDDQMPFYPLTTCVVSGEPLPEGEDGSFDFIYKNGLIRLCCEMCAQDFDAKPGAYLAKLDDAAGGQQRSDYPLSVCMVSGEKLGSMGEPTDMIVAGRLIRLCCLMCEPKVKAEPTKYLGRLEKAREENS